MGNVLESLAIGKRGEVGPSDDVTLVMIDGDRTLLAIADGATHGDPALGGRQLAAVVADALLRVVRLVEHPDPGELARQLDETLRGFIAAKLRDVRPAPAGSSRPLRSCAAVAAAIHPDHLLVTILGDCFVAGAGGNDDYDYAFTATGARDELGRFGITAHADAGVVEVEVATPVCLCLAAFELRAAYFGSDGAGHHFVESSDDLSRLRSPYLCDDTRFDAQSWAELVDRMINHQRPGTIRNDDLNLVRVRREAS